MKIVGFGKAIDPLAPLEEFRGYNAGSVPLDEIAFMVKNWAVAAVPVVGIPTIQEQDRRRNTAPFQTARLCERLWIALRDEKQKSERLRDELIAVRKQLTAYKREKRS